MGSGLGGLHTARGLVAWPKQAGQTLCSSRLCGAPPDPEDRPADFDRLGRCSTRCTPLPVVGARVDDSRRVQRTGGRGAGWGCVASERQRAGSSRRRSRSACALARSRARVVSRRLPPPLAWGGGGPPRLCARPASGVEHRPRLRRRVSSRAQVIGAQPPELSAVPPTASSMTRIIFGRPRLSEKASFHQIWVSTHFGLVSAMCGKPLW